jgi:hypothetical protein
MPIRRIFLYACLTLILTSSARAQEWRGITPLHSTRVDVERLLGPAEKSYQVIYELEAGNLTVEYSTGPCGGANREGWNVPENTVISYIFSPKVKQRLADFKLDRKKFRKVRNRHVSVITHYISDEEGITYEVQGGEVDYVEYYPPRKYEHLRCGHSPDIPPQVNTRSR